MQDSIESVIATQYDLLYAKMRLVYEGKSLVSHLNNLKA